MINKTLPEQIMVLTALIRITFLCVLYVAPIIAILFMMVFSFQTPSTSGFIISFALIYVGFWVFQKSEN